MHISMLHVATYAAIPVFIFCYTFCLDIYLHVFINLVFSYNMQLCMHASRFNCSVTAVLEYIGLGSHLQKESVQWSSDG